MSLDPTTVAIPRTGRGTGAEETQDLAPASWPAIEAVLRRGEATTWLGLRSDDGVHTRPVFAAWTGTAFVHASNPRSVKARHLDRGAPCSLALHLDDLHVVVEATPRRLTEPEELEGARAAFADVYGWPTTVEGDLLDAPYAAPTSGGPPFRVYLLAPVRAHAFPTADQVAPTRFTF